LIARRACLSLPASYDRGASDKGRFRLRRGLYSWVAVGSAVALVVLLVAACGGGSKPPKVGDCIDSNKNVVSCNSSKATSKLVSNQKAPGATACIVIDTPPESTITVANTPYCAQPIARVTNPVTALADQIRNNTIELAGYFPNDPNTTINANSVSCHRTGGSEQYSCLVDYSFITIGQPQLTQQWRTTFTGTCNSTMCTSTPTGKGTRIR
jgi:hypothetical protein